jgi:hypothetical protein
MFLRDVAWWRLPKKMKLRTQNPVGLTPVRVQVSPPAPLDDPQESLHETEGKFF